MRPRAGPGTVSPGGIVTAVGLWPGGEGEPERRAAGQRGNDGQDVSRTQPQVRRCLLPVDEKQPRQVGGNGQEPADLVHAGPVRHLQAGDTLTGARREISRQVREETHLDRA